MKEQARKDISELVKRFEEQYESYKSGSYNETATRRDFIDPFFKALGWDMDNKQGAAEAYREVIHEDKVTVGEQKKSPDYSFRLPGGKRLFFVEAKKPSVLIKEEIPPAYQVKRYAWSAKLPISILTDFEEFATTGTPISGATMSWSWSGRRASRCLISHAGIFERLPENGGKWWKTIDACENGK